MTSLGYASIFSYAVCPGIMDDSTCLYLYPSLLTWSQGELMCSLMGAKHVSVDDERRQTVLHRDILTYVNQTVWLGGKLTLTSDWMKSASQYNIQYDSRSKDGV